eukprot:GILI01035628.1.p1 GENE.GILI01035628.1~~GILI01035628.1.p1  ORF type:complete len:333 (-),score=20.81 GILI01035628.1:179-1117(-)
MIRKSVARPSPEDYISFRSSCALQKSAVFPNEESEWSYFDFGPKDSSTVPLVLLHGTSGTADIFYKQLLSLGSKGYRVISAQYPPYWSHDQWVKGFDRFLDHLKLRQVHVLGTGLGGFLAQLYCGIYPRRVLSLILCNSFRDTEIYFRHSPCRSLFRSLPEFYLKKYILDSFPSGPFDDEIADAVDFMVQRLESLRQAELASRLTLNCLKKSAPTLRLDQSTQLTFIDTLDKIVLPPEMLEELYASYPNARYAQLKSGGDFPFLSRADEFNVHIQLHLKVNGFSPYISSALAAAAADGAELEGVDDVTEVEL